MQKIFSKDKYSSCGFFLKPLTALLYAIPSLLLTGCIADEAKNMECDVEQIWLHVDNAESVFYSASDTMRSVSPSQTDIVFKLRTDVTAGQLAALAPQFKITEGATISPASGTVRDFLKGPQQYVVTSEDGQWSRVYKVSFDNTLLLSDKGTPLHLDFSKYVLDPTGKYYEWTEYFGDDVQIPETWASGNPGFRIAKSSAKPDQYPAVPSADGGAVGNSPHIILRTCDTGAFGHMAGMPLAAGNIFLGNFDVTYALQDAMQATAMGHPFSMKPLRLEGYYKYKPGEQFKDISGKVVEGKVDVGNIYAVFYLNHTADGKSFVLHGDDVLTSPQIVAVAQMKEMKTTDQWTSFSLAFDYQKEVDPLLLAEHGYSLTIVGTSSIEGDLFSGAVGSELRLSNLVLYSE